MCIGVSYSTWDVASSKATEGHHHVAVNLDGFTLECLPTCDRNTRASHDFLGTAATEGRKQVAWETSQNAQML